MKYLAFLLIAVVFIRHDTSYAVGELLGVSPKAAYYVLGGIQETILWAVVAVLLLGFRNVVWRSMALGACVIGMIEGAMIPVCRLALKEPTTGNVCDAVTGLPIGGTLVATYALVICLFLAKRS